ncbi:hypothetical protein ACNHKD_15860 [Methylocystis sp. JAN1]
MTYRFTLIALLGVEMGGTSPATTAKWRGENACAVGTAASG